MSRRVCSHVLIRVFPKPSSSAAAPSSRLCQRNLHLLLSPASSSFRLQRLVSNAGWTHPQFEVGAVQAFRLSTMASPVSERDGNPDSSAEEATTVSGDDKGDPVIESTDESTQNVKKEEAADSTGKEQEDLDKEALLSSLAEQEALLQDKDKQLAELKERALTSMAELENVRDRLKREAENTKKYAIQEFAKSLLDVADNLGRAIATVPEHIRNEALANETSEVAKYLKSLLEGVMMTEKELMKILKKFGVEKFDPVGLPFDPNLHLALFEVNDPTKEPGTVAVAVKAGYMLHDRILRPAEVGVVKSREDS